MYKIAFFVFLVLTLVAAGTVKSFEDVTNLDPLIASEAKQKAKYNAALEADAKYKPFKEAVSSLSKAYKELENDYDYYYDKIMDPFYYIKDAYKEYLEALNDDENADDLVFKAYSLSYKYYMRRYFYEYVVKRRVITMAEAIKASEKLIDEFAEMKDSIKQFVLNSVTPFIKSINTDFTYAKDLLDVEYYEDGIPDEKMLNTFYSNIDKIIDLAKSALRVYLKLDEQVQALIKNGSLSESDKIKKFTELFKNDPAEVNAELKSLDDKIREIGLLYPCNDFVSNADSMMQRLLPKKSQLKKPASLLDKLPDYIKNAKLVSNKEEVPQPQEPTLKRKFGDKVKSKVKSINNNLSNALKKLQLKKSKKSKK